MRIGPDTDIDLSKVQLREIINGVTVLQGFSTCTILYYNVTFLRRTLKRSRERSEC